MVNVLKDGLLKPKKRNIEYNITKNDYVFINGATGEILTKSKVCEKYGTSLGRLVTENGDSENREKDKKQEKE